METKRQRLIKLLKKNWLSNWKACYLIKSAHADREIRRIRENPPVNYELQERNRKEKIQGHTTVYKEYMLTEKVLQNCK